MRMLPSSKSSGKHLGGLVNFPYDSDKQILRKLYNLLKEYCMFSLLLRVPIHEVSWLKPQLTPNYKGITCHSTLTSRTHFTQFGWMKVQGVQGVFGWWLDGGTRALQKSNLNLLPLRQSPFICFAEFCEFRIIRLESTWKPTGPRTSTHHN